MSENSTFRVREISAASREDLNTVADLHMQLLHFGPMAGLGHGFIRDACYRIYMTDERLRVALAEYDGKAAGFVAYTPYAYEFSREGLRKHFWSATWALARSLIRAPWRIVNLSRALKIYGAREHEAMNDPEPAGELVSIAVLPEFVAAGFVHSTGIRVSVKLIRHVSDFMYRAGIGKLRAIVDADNLAAKMLYHSLGATFCQASQADEQRSVAWLQIADFNDVEAGATRVWCSDTDNANDAGDWQAFWESVTERSVVFAAESRDYVARLNRIVGVEPWQRVLDFGCGFGYTARCMSPMVKRIAVWDSSSTVRRIAQVRTAHLENLDLADFSAAETPPPEGVYDMILVHSVIQYMQRRELESSMVTWCRHLTRGGRLVVSDVLTGHGGTLGEILEFLRFSMANGFFWNALVMGASGILGYWQARNRSALLTVTLDDIQSIIENNGLPLTAVRLPENLSHRTHRGSFLLQKNVD